MLHVNNLDLAIFPAMSKQHLTLLNQSIGRVATADEIRDTVKKVWNDCSSASIARGFILVNRIAKKVIEYNGSNTFLQKKDFHTGLRKDFQDTANGVVKRINVVS